MSIAAASIVVKTMRDALMRNLGSNTRNMASPNMSAMLLSGAVELWPRRVHAPITGARFDLSRKKNDPRPKKVSKGLKSNIL